MIIKFSRHAKRRAQLYEIPEPAIEKILHGFDFDDGEHVITENISGFKFPIKIVFSVKKNTITIITNYPLKKGRNL